MYNSYRLSISPEIFGALDDLVLGLMMEWSKVELNHSETLKKCV